MTRAEWKGLGRTLSMMRGRRAQGRTAESYAAYSGKRPRCACPRCGLETALTRDGFWTYQHAECGSVRLADGARILHNGIFLDR